MLVKMLQDFSGFPDLQQLVKSQGVVKVAEITKSDGRMLYVPDLRLFCSQGVDIHGQKSLSLSIESQTRLPFLMRVFRGIPQLFRYELSKVGEDITTVALSYADMRADGQRTQWDSVSDHEISHEEWHRIQENVLVYGCSLGALACAARETNGSWDYQKEKNLPQVHDLERTYAGNVARYVFRQEYNTEGHIRIAKGAYWKKYHLLNEVYENEEGQRGGPEF